MSNNDNFWERAYDTREDAFDYYMEVMENYAKSEPEDRDYWQGRKDATRAMMIFIDTILGDFDKVKAHKMVMGTSPNGRV